MSYHQQACTSQYLAKRAAQPLLPLQFFTCFRRSGSCHLSLFCPPEPSLPTHTPGSVPCPSHWSLGHSHPSHRRGTESSITPPIRELPVWLLAWAALAMSTLRAKGGYEEESPRLAGPNHSCQIWSAHRCGEREHGAARLPAHALMMWWNTSTSTLWPLLHRCCMCGLCLSIILPASSSLSSAATRDEIVVLSVQLCHPKRSAGSLDACWRSFGDPITAAKWHRVLLQINNHPKCSMCEIGHMLMLLRIKRFKIEDEGLVKDKLAAWACIRLDRLQPGYRFIDLKDAHGRPSAGKLLVNIEKKFR